MPVTAVGGVARRSSHLEVGGREPAVGLSGCSCRQPPLASGEGPDDDFAWLRHSVRPGRSTDNGQGGRNRLVVEATAV